MSPRAKFIVSLLVFTGVLIGALSGLYLRRRSDDLAEQFRERSLWRAQVFAGLAPQHLRANDWNELFSTIFTAFDVLYAHVVYKGQVRAMHGLALAPPVQPLAQENLLYGAYIPQILEGRTAEGQVYLDILYPLSLYIVEESPDPESYVRLGLSRAPFEQERRDEILLIVLVALVALALSWLIVWWLAHRFFPETTQESERVTSFPVRAESDLAVTQIDSLAPQTVQTNAAVMPDLVVDNLGKRVFLQGVEVKVSPKEYELLRLLASEPGRVFSNEEILQTVWAGRQWATAQDVKQYIYFIRKKIEADPENPQFIVTVRGFGYKLNLD
jgi:DNA-binding winged helix-turn-helix (wHTH) protein